MAMHHTYQPSFQPLDHQIPEQEPEEDEITSGDASSSASPNDVESPIPNPEHIKRLRLLVHTQKAPVQEEGETPATRLKSRPRRANAFAGQTGHFSESDSDDEDYVAPKSATSLSTKKNRERMRTNPLASNPRSPDSIYKYPTNAFPALGTYLRNTSTTPWHTFSELDPYFLKASERHELT